MSIKQLDALFRPSSIAVIGASEKADSLGTHVMRNLIAGEFGGPVMPVNPDYESVLGILCYGSIDELPKVPSLAVICTPPWTVPNLLIKLGEAGTGAAVLMTSQTPNGDSEQFYREIRNAAQLTGMRVLGPASMGLQVPTIGLNASWLAAKPQPGKLALISQSSSVCSGVVEWGTHHGIGFSHVISTGGCADVDIGDLLDYLGLQVNTRAVLLYLREIQQSRKFLSAARALARIKPIIAIRAGSISEASAESPDQRYFDDSVFDAAIRRAGLLRVSDTDELFDAAETLTYARTLKGDRLAILCNGSGPGQMAADALLAGRGRLSRFSVKSREALSRFSFSGNPIDIGRDADAARYVDVLKVLLQDSSVDAVLVMFTPTPLTSSEQLAEAVAEVARKTTRNILACWLGESEQSRVREIFASAGIPLYISPDKAARAFLHLVHYHRNQEMLLQTPSTPPPSQAVGRELAREIVETALHAGQRHLDEVQSGQLLSAYGIPTTESALVQSIDEAVAQASLLGFPVSLRLSAPHIGKPFSVGGISFDLASEDAVRSAAEGIVRRFQERYPETSMPGLVVQRMVRRNDPLVLMAGIAHHPAFGRVIRFGAGGISRNLQGGPTIALPPLNMSLADELIQRSSVADLVANAENHGISREALCWMLTQLSELSLALPEIEQLEINPLLVDSQGIVALDARAAITPWDHDLLHVAIRPYPSELESTLQLRDGRRVTVRPIRPEDEPAYEAMLARVETDDLRLRFHGISKMPRSLLAQLIHIDYDREMAFVAATTDGAGRCELLGVVDITPSRSGNEAEFGILVRSDLKGTGLGRGLLSMMIDYSRQRGFDTLFGLVVPENAGMLGLAKRMGFRSTPLIDDDSIKIYLPLR
ncbi:MAG: bifunctional acetate--CoA ligase family protein/GNAT family N-acetyltransferase [Gammaproteobacteria bacterium]